MIRGYPWALLWATAAAGSLLGVAVSLLAAPGALIEPAALAEVVLANLVCCGAVLALLYLPALFLREQREPLQNVWLAGCSALVVAGQAVIPALVITDGLIRNRSLAVVPLALGLAVLVSILLAALAAAALRPLRPRTALLGSVGASALLVAVWLRMFHLRPPLPLTLGLALAFLLLTLGTLRLGRKPGRTTLPALLIALCALCLPLLPALWADSPAGQARLHRDADKRAHAATADWPAERPKQVILLTADTFRGDLLGAKDAAGPLTPNLNRLAERSMLFTDAISASCWTKPAFASIMSGLMPAVHQVLTSATPLALEIDTLAERLRAAGYLTAGFQGNPQLRRIFNFDQGFAEYRTISGHLGDSIGATLLERYLPGPRRDTTRLLTDRASAWIQAHRDRPFFLWLHYLDPHMSYRPPPEFLPPGKLAPSIGREFSDLTGVREGRKLSPSERATIAALYHGEARYVDAEIGRLLATLDDMGLTNDMLLVFTSDHGEEFWEHGGFEHGHSFHRELLHVPLLFKLPGDQTAGDSISTPVSTSAIPATVLQLVGLAAADSTLLTPSLAGIWDQPAPAAEDAAKRPIFSQGALYFEEGAAVTFGRHKYIRHNTSGREELFDLTTDPGEQHSIAAGTPAVIDSARALLQSYAEDGRVIRERLGLRDTGVIRPPANLRRELEALGYVQ